MALKSRDYTISVLKDFSRLDEVYRLTHDTFVMSGEILPQDNGMIATCPHLDKHPNSIILIAEQKDKIIGTITATIDSEIGLNIENWFEKEVNEYRKILSYNLGSSWRLATDPSFRGSRRLVINLIGRAFNLLIEYGCDICLCALMSKHIKTYQRLMDAEVITTKSVSFDNDIPMELNLVQINLQEGWNKFKRLNVS